MTENDSQTVNCHKEFLKSPQHAALLLLTLGAGFASGLALPLIVGATAYALGWVYLPDTNFFKSWLDSRRKAAEQAYSQQKLKEFITRRDSLLASLDAPRQERYAHLAAVCQSIEESSSESQLDSGTAGPDPRLRKLDELMWTFLRLLSYEQSLERYLEIEASENLANQLAVTEEELTKLKSQAESLRNAGDAGTEARQRLADSRQELVDVLRKRITRAGQADSNLHLVRSEQERLEQQIKLIRADALALKNTDALTARIDATIGHLEQTNKWLSEMDELKSIDTGLPFTDERIGFKATVAAPSQPTPQPQPTTARNPQRAPPRQRQ